MENLVTSFQGASVLLTGHSGFKGAWLSAILASLGASVHGLSLQPNRDPSSAYARLDIGSVVTSEMFVDICDADLGALVRRIEPDFVFHLAAQALVSVSWKDPSTTYRTNVYGTFALLDALRTARRHPRSTVVVTSDKVYANDGAGRSFVESDPLGGSDPYSNSKACAETVVAGFAPHLGSAVGTARAGNVIGGGDVAQDRLLPDIIRAWRSANDGASPWLISLRRPTATRPWQHVVEPLSGYLAMAAAHAEGRSVPAALNFGPRTDSAYCVSEVVDVTCEELGSGRWLASGDASFEEATSLGIDPSLAGATLGWKPQLTLREAIAATVSWERFVGSPRELRELTVEQFDAVRGVTSVKKGLQ